MNFFAIRPSDEMNFFAIRPSDEMNFFAIRLSDEMNFFAIRPAATCPSDTSSCTTSMTSLRVDAPCRLAILDGPAQPLDLFRREAGCAADLNLAPLAGS